MRKTLIILRHGKAEPARAAQEDHERPLAERGVMEAGLVGAYMAKQDITPHTLLCSTATRTRETYQEVQKAHGQLPPGMYEDGLYMASERQLLQRLAQLPEDTESVMLIGHNPGLHELCIHLCAHGAGQAVRKLSSGFPTCSLAVITLDIPAWKDIVAARGTLQAFVIPAELHA